jgi:2-keto-4-pentenoate hydratase
LKAVRILKANEGIHHMSDSAVNELARRRRDNVAGPRLPEADRPRDFVEAFALQRRAVAQTGLAIAGWKASVAAGDRLFLAPILAPMMHRAGDTCALRSRAGIAQIEPEVAFVMKRDLPAREAPYSEKEIRDAIAEARCVVELLGTRYDAPESVSGPEMVADSANNQGLVIGPAIDNAFGRPIARFPVKVSTAGRTLHERDGAHGDGDPLLPLYWLANFLRNDSDHLRAGQIVTTGSYAGAVDVPLDAPLTVTFGELGSVDTRLREQAPARR